MPVAIDTLVLIYATGPRNPYASGTSIDKLRAHARMLIWKLEHEQAQIILPTVALAEYLVPMSKDQRARVLDEVCSRFIVRPFDVAAAGWAADLHKTAKSLGGDDAYPKGQRHVLKADAMLIATARAAGASAFYTSDKRCRKLASNIIEAFDLPKSTGDMFADAEIKAGDL